MQMSIRSHAARRVAVASMLGALVVGVAGCSSDSADSTTTEPSAASEAASAPATTEETTGEAGNVAAGLWIEAVAVPPVAVCLFVSEDGTALTSGTDCNGGLEVEFEAVPGCPANGKLSIKGSGDTPIEGGKAVVTDANGTATVTFDSDNSATVVAGSDSDPECTYTFENVTSGR